MTPHPLAMFTPQLLLGIALSLTAIAHAKSREARRRELLAVETWRGMQ